MSARAISVNAYWAWAIREGHKRVENRNWSTRHRGQLLIHAAKNDEHDHEAIRFITSQLGFPMPHDEIAALRGCIIARCELVSCDPYRINGVAQFSDPWAWGPICWTLSDARPLPPIPTRGLPSIFHVDVSLDD